MDKIDLPFTSCSRRIAAAIALSTFFITGAFSTCYATGESEIKEEISSLKEQEEEIKKSLESQGVTLFNYSEEIRLLEEESEEAENALKEKKQQIIDSARALLAQRQSMRKRIKYTYENPKRGQNAMALLFTLIGNQFTDSTEYTRAIVDYDKKQILEYDRRTKDLKKEREEYAKQKKICEETKDSLEEKKAVLLSEIAKNENSFSIIEEKRLAKEKELSELLDRMKQYETTAFYYSGGLSLEEKYARIAESEGSSGRPVSPAPGEEELLAAIIYCEAGGEPYEGQLAVGSVVLNRVNNSRFPNNITDVIYAPKQFSPVGSGRLALALSKGLTSESCKRAARDVLSGHITGKWLYFRVNDGSRSGVVIGKQVFY